MFGPQQVGHDTDRLPADIYECGRIDPECTFKRGVSISLPKALNSWGYKVN